MVLNREDDMKKLSLKKTIPAPAEITWKIISRLTGLEDYLPLVKTSSLSNEDVAIRTVVLQDGSTFHETILRLDHSNMEFLYDIQDPSPFPYSNFTGFIKITPSGMSSCVVRWSAVFQPGPATEEEIKDFLHSVFTAAISGIERYCRVLQAN
jgi:hypothetical protein